MAGRHSIGVKHKHLSGHRVSRSGLTSLNKATLALTAGSLALDVYKTHAANRKTKKPNKSSSRKKNR